jgi:hypothetical protein
VPIHLTLRFFPSLVLLVGKRHQYVHHSQSRSVSFSGAKIFRLSDMRSFSAAANSLNEAGRVCSTAVVVGGCASSSSLPGARRSAEGWVCRSSIFSGAKNFCLSKMSSVSAVEHSLNEARRSF